MVKEAASPREGVGEGRSRPGRWAGWPSARVGVSEANPNEHGQRASGLLFSRGSEVVGVHEREWRIAVLDEVGGEE